MKKNRTAGFTLMEMLIAMGISMIVILGVSQFMVTSTNTYQAVDTQVTVQMDAQDALNTITDMVMEGNNIAKRQMNDGSDVYVVYYNLGQQDSSGNVYTFSNANQRMFWLDSSTHNLYLIHTKDTAAFNAAIDTKAGKQLLAEGVASFQIRVKNAADDSYSALQQEGLSANAAGSLLNVQISFSSDEISRGKKAEGFDYEASQDVVIRNRIVGIMN